MAAPDYDVIVVGSGAAGLSAAISAAGHGATVLVVEADTQVGGSSRLSGGHFYAADTSLQRRAGIRDSAARMFHHYMTLNQWLVEPAVVRRYCDLSGATFEWLQNLGVNFPRNGLYQSGVGTIPRGHQPEGGGQAVIHVLDAHRQKLGIDMVFDTRVDTLVTNNKGAITGIRSGNVEASAGAVVIATGGFGANDALIKKYYPQAWASGDWRWYIGTDKAQGDGLQLGRAVGAGIQGENRGLLLVTPGFSRDLEVLLPNWLILVNAQGRRFADETAPYTVLSGLIQQQAAGSDEPGRVWAVFDETARANAKPNPASQAYWVADVLARKADEGIIHRAPSLAALADAMGCHGPGLQGTVQTYNEHLNPGQGEAGDPVFFKTVTPATQPIQTPPFYAVEVQQTMAGRTSTA